MILPSHFFRYCEVARWQIFDAPEFVLKGKIAGAVVRAQTVEIEDELGYGDELVITTFLARVGKTSLDFGHVLERKSGARVAISRCTIVQVGPDGPKPFDASLAAFALDEPLPAHARPGGPLTGEVFELPFIVRPSDTDAFSHVNQARYADFVDDARILAARAEHPAGATGRLRSLSIEYARETLAGDAIVTRIAAASSLERRFELTRRGEVLTRAFARLGSSRARPPRRRTRQRRRRTRQRSRRNRQRRRGNRQGIDTLDIAEPSPVSRADELWREIRATLVYLLDDGAVDARDVQLAKIDADHADAPETLGAIALRLDDYARYAKKHARAL
ncbi:MAG: acyl-CoA thioesterase, partial [Polyangiaceae bacterium]|nr:acyl-CoA thioesterase [Polyangiaceae bacterium]